MTTLLLDASVLLAAFDPENEHHKPARVLLEDDDVTLATLDLVRYEVVNVAVRAWRAPKSVAPLLAWSSGSQTTAASFPQRTPA